MEKINLAILLILFTGIASAQSFHEVEADQQEMKVNTTVTLHCNSNCPVNRWNLEYRLPDDSEMLGVEDSLGEITDYSYSNGVLDLQTNSGQKRNNETLKINYRVDRPAEQVKESLFSRKISFAGFRGEKTSGVIEVDGLLSGRISNAFRTSYSDKLEFEGEGPVQVDFNFGNGSDTNYYSFFDGFIDSDESYEIALGTTGFQQEYDKIPVAIYDEDYDDRGFEWSAGEYSSGVIHMRREEEDRMKVVLTHETVHALSDKPLRWDRTQTSYIEEGISKHAESLIQKKLYREGESDRKPAELFGDEVSYREGSFRYTIPSKGDRDQLWKYYQEDRDFMKEWNPQKQNREFGYAYSELIIKNHLIQGGNVSSIYSTVHPDERIESSERKWSLYSDELDMKPCDLNSREEFDLCLDEINSHNYDIRIAKPVQNDSGLNLEKIEVPERELKKSFGEIFMQRLQAFIDEVKELWNSF